MAIEHNARYFVDMKFVNKRFPPTEPGNDPMIYGEGKVRGRGVSGSCTYENPTQEKIGRSLAKICLYFSYGFHLIVFPVMLITSWFFSEEEFAGDMLLFWVVGMTGSVILLTLGRIVANHLTRKEEHISYKALTVLFSGGVIQLLVIVVFALMRR